MCYLPINDLQFSPLILSTIDFDCSLDERFTSSTSWARPRSNIYRYGSVLQWKTNKSGGTDVPITVQDESNVLHLSIRQLLLELYPHLFKSLASLLDIVDGTNDRAHIHKGIRLRTSIPFVRTYMAIWPKPRPGSEFPLAYPLKSGSSSVPWLCVNSRIPSRLNRFFAFSSAERFSSPF